MRKLLSIMVIALAVTFCGLSDLNGQSQFGTITGRVADPTQAVVPGAKVTVTNLATNVVKTAQTNAEGIYVFASLPAGEYVVAAETQGFRKTEKTITLTVAQRLEVDFTLEVGSTTQVVTVTESATAVNTTTGELSDTITPSQVINLPLLTRNVYNLVGLAPGAADTGQVTGDTRGLGYAVNGQRTADINFMLDGGENNDTFVAGVGQTVPLDAVQEIRVQTNNMTAEYGRNPVVVNAVTKSGSNAFHGSGWEFYRGASLSAAPFDDNASGTAKSNFVRNQFGGAIGGPVVKDKTFFFGSFEGLRIRSAGTAHFYVPTQAFLDAASPNANNFITGFGGLPQSNPNVCINADYLMGIEDTTDPWINHNTGQPIPGSTNLFCRTTVRAPIDAGAGDPQNNWNFTARLDHHFTDNTALFGRYAFSQIKYSPGTVSLSPYQGFNTGEDDRNQNLNLTLTHSFTPNLYSESRIVYNRILSIQPLGEASSTTPCWQYDYFNQTPTGDGITFPGYVPDVCYYAGIPFGGPQNIYQGYQGFTWSHGKHTFKWGAQYIHMRDNRSFGSFENAYMDTFTAQGLLDGQTDFIYIAIDPKGKVPGDTYSTATDGPFVPPSFTRHFHYNEVAWYAEDSIKVTPRLTLTAGLRWEYFGVLHSPANEKYLDANLFLNAVGPATTNIYEQIRDARFQRTNHIYRSDYNNFAPRIGIAYDIFGNGRSVFRGGYGIFYDRNFGNALFNVIQNPPNYMVVSLVPLGSYGAENAPIEINQFDTLSTLAGASTTLSSSARMMNPDMDTAYSEQWNATLEHNFFGKGVIGTASYVGSSGIKLYSLNNLNQLGSCLVAPGINAVCNPAGGNSSRLNQTGLTGMNRRGNEGLSRYNGLSVGIRTPHLQKTGLLIATNYTWSHSIDNESSFFADSPFEADWGFGFRNGFAPGFDRASSTNDIRHRYSLAWEWAIPGVANMTGVSRQALGGWTISGILSAQTGGAFSVYDGSSNSQCNNDATNFCYPLLTGSVPALGFTPVAGAPNSFTAYNIGSTFETQQAYCGGDLACTADLNILHYNLLSPRNLFRTPGYWNWDLAVLKDFQLPREGMKLQFRAEFFNLPNHSNYYISEGSNLFSGSDSTVVGVRGLPPGGGKERRNIQLALRFIF